MPGQIDEDDNDNDEREEGEIRDVAIERRRSRGHADSTRPVDRCGRPGGVT
jgi:hypothetical protein